jgi:uncharacterized protein
MGTIVNVVAIVLGSSVGLVIKSKINQDLQEHVMTGLGLCVLVIGVNGIIGFKFPLTIIGSIVVGTLIGNALALESRLDTLIVTLQQKFGMQENKAFSEGFIIATSVYVIGAMAILGAIQSGFGDDSILLAKSMLDGVSSIFFAASYGLGVMFSAVPVLIYQGLITVFAQLMQGFFGETLIYGLEMVGSILIIAISLNMLKLRKISVLNMLPSLIIVALLIQFNVLW